MSQTLTSSWPGRRLRRDTTAFKLGPRAQRGYFLLGLWYFALILGAQF
jgi:hypothetical protein